MRTIRHNSAQKGFTLLEVAAITIIVGIILTLLVPKISRTTAEAKYQLLRQNCTELAGWANEWARREHETQPIISVSTLNDYMDTLGNLASGLWVADSTNGSNWQGSASADLESIPHRGGLNIATAPYTSVHSIMPDHKPLSNPFNGLSLFHPANLPSTNAVTGAIACAFADDGGYNYYALIFQGIDSDTVGDFYPGQGPNTTGLKNGIFITRLIP